MDYTNSPTHPTSQPHGNANANAGNTPASIFAAASSSAASTSTTNAQQQHHRFPVSSLSASSTSSLPSSRKITLERVVSSQFENEAETHILAALEMDDGREQRGGISGQSQLLGEGIERGMEDYSDDDDDVNMQEHQQSQQQGSRSRTWSNDVFLRNVTKQNDLPQYQIRLPPGPEGDYEQERQHSPPHQQQQQSQPSTMQHQQQEKQQSQPPQPAQLRRYISENLPPIDEHHLALHIQREHYEDGGIGGDASLFVEAAKRVSSGDATTAPAATALRAGDGNGGDGSGNNDLNNATQQGNLRGVIATKGSADALEGDNGAWKGRVERGSGGGGVEGGGPSTIPTTNMVDGGVNTMTDVTETTDNMNFMANRLRSLQQRRGSLQRKKGSLNFNNLGFSSRSNTSTDDGGASSSSVSSSLMGNETSGDKLIDALNSVDSSKNKSFLSKIRSEYTELIVPKLPQFRKNIAHILLYMVIPFLAVAAVLFYMCDNPMAGNTGTSVSWWILFLGVRQPIIFELTLVGEVFWVEIFALRSKLFNRAVGPYISLAFIQSRGW